ncbi:MAG: diphosphomevalonate decarboxylase [Bacteroidia bacterium]
MIYNSTWKSPSNIALVKYWGKKENGIQLPANASISFTLNQCQTTTQLTIDDERVGVEVYLDGESQPDFVPKIEQFKQRIADSFPSLVKAHWTVKTSNSFPHSSGIASSASGMSALALCLCDIAVQQGLLPSENLEDKASELSRLGSGSACRSVFGPMAVWGTHPEFDGSSDLNAIAYNQIDEVFKTYCDTILLIHKGSKDVSSTQGHNLIKNHPFAEQRFSQAQGNMSKLQKVLKEGDLDEFIEIVEQEALSLHALMMTSTPSYILMKPNTLAAIEAIWKIRKEKGYKWCFTLDAGANLHFLFPKTDEPFALEFVEKVLKQYCQDGAYICDQVGNGPQKL